MKNCKTFYETQQRAALNPLSASILLAEDQLTGFYMRATLALNELTKSFCLSKPDKILPRLRNKNFLTEKFFYFENAVLWCQEMMQMFFLKTNRKMLAGKFIK